MITEKLYDADSHLTEFEAEVCTCEKTENGYCITLDRTAFFPEAGGQASDRGTLETANVLDVRIENGVIYHYTDAPLEIGSKVSGSVDFERRFDYMQQHSGEHMVSGVAHNLYGVENVGFHLGDDIVTLDFDKELDRYSLDRIEKLVNEAIYKNVKFRTYYPDEKVLETLEYRSKKELEGAVRIVEIENVDRCACCAPHVYSAGEIGVVKLLDTERLRGGVRIEIKCGRRAVADYNEKYRNVKEIGALLSAGQHETADAVGKLCERMNNVKQENSALKKRLIEAIIASSGSKKAVFAENLDRKELQLLADGMYKAYGGVRAAFAPVENGYAFAVCGEAEKTDELFSAFRSAFAVKGGGRGGMIQGTVAAEITELQSFFE